MLTKEELLRTAYLKRADDVLVMALAECLEAALTEIETLKGNENES